LQIENFMLAGASSTSCNGAIGDFRKAGKKAYAYLESADGKRTICSRSPATK